MNSKSSDGVNTPPYFFKTENPKNSTSFGLADRIAAPAANGRPNEGGNSMAKLEITFISEDGGVAAYRLEKRTLSISVQ